MIITIGRECGCDGDEVAARLASRFGLKRYTKKEIVKLAKEKGIYDKYPFFFGEKAIDSMMQSVSDDFVVKRRKTPEEALAKLLEGQDCVVVGRASDYAFKNREDAVRIFLCGDRNARIRRIMDKHDISEREAAKIVDETDARRKSYHDYYSGENWGYSGHYDLCLDEVKLGIDGVVDMVEAYIRTIGRADRHN